MSDAILSETTATVPEPTPLAQGLLAGGSALALDPQGGRLTPHLFDDTDREVGSLLTGAGALDLGWLERFAVTEGDQTRWLTGMVTNAVQNLAEGEGNYNFLLNAQGRILGDAYAWREAGRLVLETTSAQIEKLLAHLDHYIIMDDVELHRLNDLTALGLAGPQAAAVLAKLGVEDADNQPLLSQRQVRIQGVPVLLARAYSVLVPRFELWFERSHALSLWQALVAAGAAATGAQAASTLRIAEGIPEYGTDIEEKHLAQETAQTRALNFNKGCYLGQEVVERIRSRATIHRILQAFELKGALPSLPAALTSEGKPAGNISSAARLKIAGAERIFALGFVRIELIERKAGIEYEGGVALPLEAPLRLAQP